MNDWPHQRLAMEELAKRVFTNQKSLCITSPTGMGKSRIIQRVCEWSVESCLRVAVFTNRRLLTSQLSRGLNAAGIQVGVRAAEFESWSDPSAMVQICSTPTEASRVFKARDKARQRLATPAEAERDYKLAPAEMVIIDEVHMNKAEGMSKIVGEYRGKYDAFILGITATPLGVSHLCEELVVAGTNSEGRDCGALVPAHCYEPAVFDLHKVYRSKHEIWTQKQLETHVRHIWTQHVVGHIFTEWKRRAEHLPTICMTPGVKESLGLAQEFQRRGVNAAHIDGQSLYIDGKIRKTTDQEARDELFAKMKDGSIPIVFNRFVLREAIDLPFLGCLILATPIASPLSYVQTVGRVLRASPGKDKALIIDHAGNIRLHGSPNMDRDHLWQQYFYEDETKLQRDRQNQLRDPDFKEPEPITCPECSGVRTKGPKCPFCGFEHQASVRRVIQESGQLVPVTGDVYPKRITKIKPDTIALWQRIYYSMRRKSKTFGQAYAWFIKLHGYRPPRDLPLMPKHSLDWTRKMTEVAMTDLFPAQPQPPERQQRLQMT